MLVATFIKNREHFYGVSYHDNIIDDYSVAAQMFQAMIANGFVSSDHSTLSCIFISRDKNTLAIVHRFERQSDASLEFFKRLKFNDIEGVLNIHYQSSRDPIIVMRSAVYINIAFGMNELYRTVSTINIDVLEYITTKK